MLFFDLFGHVFNGRSLRVGDREGETLSLQLKILAVPFIKAACEIGRATDLLEIVRDLARLDAAEKKSVLTVEFDRQIPIFRS